MKDAAWNAVLDLLRCKTIDEIRVSEIISLANVGRSAFYRNFLDKYDVVNWGFTRMCDAHLERWKNDGSARGVVRSPSSSDAEAEGSDSGESAVRASAAACLSELRTHRCELCNAFCSRDKNGLRNHAVDYVTDFVLALVFQEKAAGVDETTRSIARLYSIGAVDHLIDWLKDSEQGIDEFIAVLILSIPAEFLSIIISRKSAFD